METSKELWVIACTASESIRLFSDRKTAFIFGTRQRLPRRQFELLEHFLLYGENTVFTCEELLNDLWKNEIVADVLIAAYVYRLRRLLACSHGQCRIETVRGIRSGYWFVTEKGKVPIELSFQKGGGGEISLYIGGKLTCDGKHVHTLAYGMLHLLLKVFVDHFAKTLSRKKIAATLPSTRREQLRTIDNHVLRLRACLPGTGYKIETVPNEGFRFIDTSLAG